MTSADIDLSRFVDAVWHQVMERGATIHKLFGSPDDAKLVSSLTLFAGVRRRTDPCERLVTRADDVLRVALEQGLQRCATTERVLAR